VFNGYLYILQVFPLSYNNLIKCLIEFLNRESLSSMRSRYLSRENFGRENALQQKQRDIIPQKLILRLV
jgi:hypothetical protein